MPNIVGLIDGGWTDVQIPDVSPSGGSWHMGTLLCVVWAERLGQCAQKRDQVAGFLPPSPLEGEQKTKPLQSRGASFGAVVHFCVQKMRVRQKHELWHPANPSP